MRGTRSSVGWRDKVLGILREARPEFDQSVWNDGARLQQDLGFDSLGLVAVALRLEEDLAVDPLALTDRAAAIVTVGDLLAVVAELRSERDGVGR